MKIVLKAVFFCDILLFILGFYTQNTQPQRGALIIGSAVSIMTFIILPLFLYVRYKDKKLSKYLFPSDPPKRDGESKKD